MPEITYSRTRQKFFLPSCDPKSLIGEIVNLANSGELDAALDRLEFLTDRVPELQNGLLPVANDIIGGQSDKSRYNLYQRRQYDFHIQSGDTVIDIGSGHLPFPLATHLADVSFGDHEYGRAGQAFVPIDGKEQFEIKIEETGLGDKQFDFVYLSHVLEHSTDPEAACREIMRIGKRGYIECPLKGKDLLCNTAIVSHHLWAVESANGRLVFTEYRADERAGINSNAVLDMVSSPQTPREKAFVAAFFLKPQVFNTMMFWEQDFAFEIRPLNGRSVVWDPQTKTPQPVHAWKRPPKSLNAASLGKQRKPRFLQIETIYERYLDHRNTRIPHLGHASYSAQMAAMLEDGFSEVHMMAPYMDPDTVDSLLLLPNVLSLQSAWAKENGLADTVAESAPLDLLRRQIQVFDPDILYFSDSISFQSSFISSLDKRPPVVAGWCGTSIPEHCDWHEYDIMLSSLSGVREEAKRRGVSEAYDFAPGCPPRYGPICAGLKADVDVVFTGSYNSNQHRKRGKYLESLGRKAKESKLSMRFHLTGDTEATPASVSRYKADPVYGLKMHMALAMGKIAFDARPEISTVVEGKKVDLAGTETANMRLFEATASGAFLLTENFDNVAKYFEPEQQLVTFSSEEEMVEKIDFYLRHPVKRDKIAQSGYERGIRDHNMVDRARKILELTSR